MSRDALVVGINSYQYLPGLNTPAQDAEAIAQRLQANGDFRVTRMPEIIQAGQPRVGIKTQVTLTDLEAALVRLFKPKGNNIPHTALFYFSGHGLQKDAGIQEGYLATSDTNPTGCFYGLSLFWLRRLLQESPVRQRIILLDCCHSGEILNYLEADPGARSGTDRLFMAASREYEVAYESIAGQYSVFTQALLDGLDPNRLASGMVTNYGLTDWVSTALKGEQQQPLFENSGSEIILTRCQNTPTVIKTRLVQDICPYRGLEYFDEADADYFFGREELTDQLIERLRSHNFVAVLGASGSGKSSLVRAGLIYKLRQGQKFSGSDRWRIQLITPTDQPLRSLASAFVNSQAPTVDRAEHLHRAEVLLKDGDAGLAHLARASLVSSKFGRNSRLLLVIDQFEEVFTLCQGPQAERDRHQFFNCLLNAVKEAQDCFSIVIILRADFFSKCSLYNGLAEKIEQNLVTVTPLTYEQIKASILKPAEKVGLMCEPNLVYNILLDVVGAPGELPLLQYTLLELWQHRQLGCEGEPARLTLDAYTELGGVRGTLQKRANEIFYSLTIEEQQVAKRIFIALTQLGEGTEDTRRRILKSELVSPQFSAGLVDRVVEKLVSTKLIVTNQVAPSSRPLEQSSQNFANVSTALRFAQLMRSKSHEHPSENTAKLISHFPTTRSRGYETVSAAVTQLASQASKQLHSQNSCVLYQETVDVAHEALIRNWDLLRSWLDENREMLRRQRRIEHAAKEWNNAHQPRSPEYLLRGNRLVDAEEFLMLYPTELSASAQHYVEASQEESRRQQREQRLVQMAVPVSLLIALAVTFNQYWTAAHNQQEKDYQYRVATSRQQAATAQSLLQDPEGDPTPALLISRVAAEQGGPMEEVQASLRASLQKLRLQANLFGHQATVYQANFNPNQRQLATAGADGSIRLWSVETHKVEQILFWHQTTTQNGQQDASGRSNSPQVSMPAIITIAFSADGQQLAAIAQASSQVKVWRTESGQLQFVLEGLTQPITKLAFSPDGNWIAASSERVVQVWNAKTGKRQAQFTHARAITSLSFSPDARSLLTTAGRDVTIWQTHLGRSQRVVRHPEVVNGATFSPDSQQIATASEDGAVRVWMANTGQLKQIFRHDDRLSLDPFDSHDSMRVHPVRQVLFSPNGKRIATVDDHHQIWLWNPVSGQLVTRLTNSSASKLTKKTATIAFSPDSQHLVTSSQGVSHYDSAPIAHLWNAATGTLEGSLWGHESPIQSINFSADGGLLATADTAGSVRLWATEMGSEFPTLKMPGKSIEWIAFQDEIVTVAADGTVQHQRLLQPSLQSSQSETVSATVPTRPSFHFPPVRTLSFVKRILARLQTWQSPTKPQPSTLWENRTIAQAPATSNALLPVQSINLAASVNTESNRAMTPSGVAAKLTEQLPSGAKLTGVAFSGQLMATADTVTGINLWQLQPNWTVKRLHQLVRAAQASQEIVFSPDQQTLLSVGSDQVMRLWNVRSGQLIKTLQITSGAVEQAQLSADGQLIVTANQDHKVRIWHVASAKVISTLPHQDVVKSASFSPDNQLVVTASQDGVARVWDVRTSTVRVLLVNHRGAVMDAKFSPDGRTIATASADGSVRLWEAQTGIEQGSLRFLNPSQRSEAMKQVFFNPNGQYLAVLSEKGNLYVWTATWKGLLELARDRSLRQLKPDECLLYLKLSPATCPALELGSARN